MVRLKALGACMFLGALLVFTLSRVFGYLPFYDLLLDLICPDRWTFYTPAGRTLTQCRWLTPVLALVEGSALGGAVYSFLGWRARKN